MSRVSLRRQKGAIKEKLKFMQDRRRNIKIWIIEDPEGEVKVNGRGNS